MTPEQKLAVAYSNFAIESALADAALAEAYTALSRALDALGLAVCAAIRLSKALPENTGTNLDGEPKLAARKAYTDYVYAKSKIADFMILTNQVRQSTEETRANTLMATAVGDTEEARAVLHALAQATCNIRN